MGWHGIRSYAPDFGGPPQTENTDALEFKTTQIQSYDPTSAEYQKSCQDLYKALSGDPGGNFNFTQKTYLKEVNIKRMVKLKSNGNPDYIKDPYGYSYGYSTAVLKLEQNFKDAIRKGGRTARRPTDPVGFSSAGYDLWSTAGNKRKPANLPAQNLLWLEWVKN